MTEQETVPEEQFEEISEEKAIEKLKARYGKVLSNMNSEKLHYIVIPGQDLGMVLCEPSLSVMRKVYAEITCVDEKGSVSEAGLILMDNCAIAGAVDNELVSDVRKRLAMASVVARKILTHDSGSKKN